MKRRRRIEIKGKVQPLQRPRVVSKGNRTWAYTPQLSVDYKERVKHECRKQFRRPLKTPVRLTITIFIKIPESFNGDEKARAIVGRILPAVPPDIDNCIKSLLDGMNGVVFEDDRQVCEIRARKFYGRERAIIEVERMEKDAADRIT